MSMRFIHKGGRVVPIHSGHGDVQEAKPANPNPPANPAPPEMGAEHNHPAPMAAVSSVASDAMAKVRAARKPGHTLKAFGHSVTVK